MNSYTHIKEALQLAEQAVYQGQMNLDAANFSKSSNAFEYGLAAN